MSEEAVRLSKVMSQRGLCSRREADELIAAGQVKVDGEIVDQLGSRISPDARIEILPRAQQMLAEKVTIIINKPKGYVSSQAEDGYENAVSLVTPENKDPLEKKEFKHSHLIGLAPAGRLDIDSQGLIIFTQDGVLAKKIIGENSEIEKEYIVRVAGSLRPENLEKLCNGTMVIEGRQLRPAKVEWINDDQLRFVLREGMKRQIRKMCEMSGLRVLGLKRVRVGQLMLGKLAEGQWRYLRPGETI
ncbi:MAG: pseudouridine synthase [Bdellovibrionales bacterium]